MSDNDWIPTPEEQNPMRAAEVGMKPPLPKRFYKEAGVEERDGFHILVLDGRRARTPGRQPLAVSSRPLAEAIAAEWAGQAAEIDPSSMPITRIVNSAIDGVAPRMADVVDDLVRYAGSDLLYYRMSEPERLAQAQNAAWDPILAWVRDTHDARFALAEGVMHVSQPAEAIAAIRRVVEEIRSPVALAALHVMTSLSGSVLLALAHVAGEIEAENAWRAAHVDELFQESVWGEDYEASERRERRWRDFLAASEAFRLAQL